MSAEHTLKEKLSHIAQNEYRVADESDVWPLTLQMMQFLGSPDPELRDKLICSTLYQWTELYFDAQQLTTLLDIALDDAHLFYGLGEQETDSVFTRTFSSLAIAAFIYRHLTQPYLTPPAVAAAQRRMLAYLSQERDLRGYVPEKGWAHAVAHAADALSQLALCPELENKDLLDMLRVIRETMARATTVFVDDEDERLVRAVFNTLKRQLLSKEEIAQWIADFATFELPPTYREWFHKRTNLKHFLRSLHFEALYQEMPALFEPTLGETLKEISRRDIPMAYFR